MRPQGGTEMEHKLILNLSILGLTISLIDRNGDKFVVVVVVVVMMVVVMMMVVVVMMMVTTTMTMMIVYKQYNQTK